VAQINLLKQNTRSNPLAQFSPKIAVQIMVVVFLALVGYYVFLFFQLNKINSDTQDMAREIQAAQQLAISNPNKDELFVRQQQIKNLKDLIAGHLYWSQIFEPLADVTLKDARYSSLKVTLPNSLSMSVKVKDLEELDKYLQVFNLPDFNKNFNNVRIGSYSKTQSATSTDIQFSVQMDFNPSLLVYKQSNVGGK
jgi:cell division protein FtsL